MEPSNRCSPLAATGAAGSLCVVGRRGGSPAAAERSFSSLIAAFTCARVTAGEVSRGGKAIGS